MEEKWILLMTHGRFCEAIVETAAMVSGKMENVYPIPLLPGMEPEAYLAQVEEILKKAPAGSYILTDIFGGTPCNIANMLIRKYDVQAFSGLNLSMLIEMDRLRSEDADEDERIDELLSLSKMGVRSLNRMAQKRQ